MVGCGESEPSGAGLGGAVTDCIDPAAHVIDVATVALRDVFDPDSECPPRGGGSTKVRFLTSDDGGLPFWDGSCKQPFLWLRVQQRYRSTTRDFPAAVVGSSVCGTGSIRVLAVELGVARCSVAGAKTPSWDKLHEEALVGLDDSWRIEKALCVMVGRLRAKDRAVGTDSIAPVGPEGDVVGHTGVAYVQF